ncbi:FCD domain-containing protein [Nocardia sp. NPDC005366]|uniref:FadR/GntR family transcriptional regulator n=1 Tax=Nocardia sp. NPDC005366 TaxID=3156878 RepID=UPI0033B59DB0
MPSPTPELGPSTVVPAGMLNSRGRPHERKLARRIATQLEDDIVRDGWDVGSVYASESELRERYNVSRAVLREAIRLIEHRGVAVMRRGPYGGLILQEPDAAPLTAAVVVYMEYVGATVEDVLSARLLLEPLASRLAAEHINEGQVATLRQVLIAERSYGAVETSKREHLHRTLATLSGNPALGVFIEVLSQLTVRYGTAPRTPGSEATALSAQSDAIRGSIVEAVVAGDVSVAERRTVRHLQAIRDWMLSARQHPIDRAGAAPDYASSEKVKLAERVAWQLLEDIATSGSTPGAVFGSEPELQARFGVSRAVFREAVRLLEYHGIARMRRGPAGGLIITEPSPAACIDSMAIYLEFQRVRSDQLREVRVAIETGIVESIVQRIEEPRVQRALQECLRVKIGTARDEIGPLSLDFHFQLARIAGNPILSHFLEILVNVWDRHSKRSAHELMDDEQISEAVDRAHSSIVEAMMGKDASLARRRMVKHLGALDQWWE